MPTPWRATRSRGSDRTVLSRTDRAGGRLVEEEEPEAAGCRASELHQPALAGREAADWLVDKRLEAAGGDRAIRSVGDLARLGSPADEMAQRSGAGQAASRRGRCWRHRHRVEQLHPLERAAEAKLGPVL